MQSNPHIGSLGTIHKDSEGNTYTEEDNGYACRFWFGNDVDKLILFMKKFLSSYSYMMGEAYLEKLPEDAVEIVREELTIKVCYDPAQIRMNDISEPYAIGVMK